MICNEIGHKNRCGGSSIVLVVFLLQSELWADVPKPGVPLQLFSMGTTRTARAAPPSPGKNDAEFGKHKKWIGPMAKL